MLQVLFNKVSLATDSRKDELVLWNLCLMFKADVDGNSLVSELSLVCYYIGVSAVGSAFFAVIAASTLLVKSSDFL